MKALISRYGRAIVYEAMVKDWDAVALCLTVIADLRVVVSRVDLRCLAEGGEAAIVDRSKKIISVM